MRPELFANSELFAVMYPRWYMTVGPVEIHVMATLVTLIWIVFSLSLFVRLFGPAGLMRWTSRGLLVASGLTALVVWGDSFYAFLFWPAVFWGCGWCWIW